MNASRAWMVVALAAALWGCDEKRKSHRDPKVVAIVNGEVVSASDFVEELSREMSSPEASTPSSPEQEEPYKRALLQSLIDRTLLLQAARAANITVPPEEVDREVMRISSDYPAEGFDEALAQGKLSLALLKQKTTSLLTIEKLFQQKVYPRVGVTEEEIRQYFDEHQADFQEPEQVRAAQIVVKTVEEARRIQTQLAQGKKFPELARKYSLSADAKLGGDLGFFERGVMPPQFDEVAFKLGANQVSDIVETDYGFHLFKVLERRPARKKELAQVRGEVERRLLERRRADAQKEYLRQLREKAQIQVNDKTLQAVSLKAQTRDADKP